MIWHELFVNIYEHLHRNRALTVQILKVDSRSLVVEKRDIDQFVAQHIPALWDLIEIHRLHEHLDNGIAQVLG